VELIPFFLACTAAAGIYFVWSATATQNAVSWESARKRIDARSTRAGDWLTQAGIPDDARRQVSGLIAAVSVAGALVGWMLFGGIVAPLASAVFASTFPVASFRQQRARARAEAADAWPRLIEEIRLMCGSLGRPIPQALIDVGKRGPSEMRPAFLHAEREWLISTDFARTVAVLKDRLADPTADVVCETLLVAHGVGGSDIDQRLAALATDRQMDLNSRKDARSKQSGVKFARRFVLLVPLGMALAGLSIGDGRDAYATAEGQVGVAAALLTLAVCWWWSGRLIKLPEERRVFRA
jgi:tight adherence protein B